jgi:acyl-CoA reductase-like NAD-dependent aldehyde dehydrogenase
MSENTLTVVDPATEKPIAELPLGGVEAVDVAVAQATRAFPAWRAVSPSDRARLMRRFATAVEESAEELAQLETANMGKPISDSRDEVAMVAEVLHFYAGAVDKHRGATSWKVGPALATGNTVVVKPAELTPLTALRLEALSLEAGIPPGVLQVVVGTGPVAGSRLAEHPDVAKVAFTGSTAVGREIMATASRTVKRVTLELGGKSANIVFADADVEQAAAAAPGGVFANAGQDCCARSRILVERSVFDRFLELLAEAVGAWRVGDPRHSDTQMGPLISANRRAVVAGYLAAGMGDPHGGAVEPLISGSVPDEPGFWFPPTVVAPAENHWRLSSEEIFGPVVAVIPFDGEDEAVRLANDTPYGLSGSIWTRDGAKALRMARAVEAGNLSINSNGSVRVQTSFGGMKQSGFGRELGLEALGAYSEVKNVFYATER